MKGAFYATSVADFITEDSAIIRDSLTENASKYFYQQLSTQTESWHTLIKLLQNSLSPYAENKLNGVLLEYSIPRRNKRIDAVLIIEDLIIVVEYKDGESNFANSHKIQIEDYCLDLRDFHSLSKNRKIIPLLLCSNAKTIDNSLVEHSDCVQGILLCNNANFSVSLSQIINKWGRNGSKLDYTSWKNSEYAPTPSIIEAAQVLYAGQDVKEISRSHAEAENLTKTTNAVLKAITEAQTNNKKIICFITGVPGAGKTLAGLNIIHNREFKSNDKELGVFLSGNSPLIKVLTEALARDSSKRQGINKKEANRRISTFVHNVHQFIDEYYDNKSKLPVDKVLVYDEAQRAWTKEQKTRKSKNRICESEPDILLSIMSRFKNSWSVIIALVGHGQEINTGEGGLKEWGNSIAKNHSDWEVYLSPELLKVHVSNDLSLFDSPPEKIKITSDINLHLDVSLRSYKAKQYSDWVNLVLEEKPREANNLIKKITSEFPVYITRSVDNAKGFLRSKLRGSRRAGMLASSGGRRLRAEGVDVNSGLKGISTQNELGAWYLNDKNDVRSSSFLEIVSSEFGIQGLELDWTCLCWDADLRRGKSGWEFRSFEGTKWLNVKNGEAQKYILNKYRVLLTRSREGIIIYVPEGDSNDDTREAEFYDPIFEYLKSCGVPEI